MLERMRGQRQRLLLGAELGRLLALAGPIIVSQLGQVGMTTADTIMVGPLGASPLAAVGVGGAVHSFTMLVATGVIIGMAPLVSQAYGAGDIAHCRRVLVQGVWLALLLSVPVVYVCLVGEALLLGLGQAPAVAALAGGYLRALAPGVAPALLFIACRQYLEGMGHSKPAMLLTFMGLAFNIPSNYVLMYGAGPFAPMGVVGTAWATTLVRWTMLLGMAGWVLGHRAYRPAGASPRLDRALLARVARVGAPVGAQFALEVGLFSFAAVMMGWLGPLQLAAHQVTINLASTTFMVALGVSLAGSIRVGQHIGARQPGALRRAVIATYLLAIGFMAMCALLFFAVPDHLVGLYTRDVAIIEVAVPLVLIAGAFQMFDGAQVAGFSVLRGAADTRAPMLIAAVGYWGVGVPLAWLLAFRTPLGARGVWAGLSCALGAVALLLVLRVRQRLWRE